MAGSQESMHSKFDFFNKRHWRKACCQIVAKSYLLVHSSLSNKLFVQCCDYWGVQLCQLDVRDHASENQGKHALFTKKEWIEGYGLSYTKQQDFSLCFERMVVATGLERATAIQNRLDEVRQVSVPLRTFSYILGFGWSQCDAARVSCP